MADVVKYGWAYGGKVGNEVRCGVSQYFNRLGAAFVTASTVGAVKLVTASTDNVIGWVEVPRANWSTSDATVDYYLSGTTVAKDKVHLISDPTAVYCCPADETVGSVAASLIGKFVCASAEGSTTTLKQLLYAKASTVASHQQFFVVDVDTDNRTLYVRINPHHII